MEKFKVYTLYEEYVVLKCPLCSAVFRYDYRQFRFGQEVKNAKCQKCEKMFDVGGNCQSKDNLYMPWSEGEFILTNPLGETRLFKPHKEPKGEGLVFTDASDYER